MMLIMRMNMVQLTAHSSQLTAHSSQLTAHSSQLTAHSSQLTAHSSQLTAHSSQLTAHSSQLTAHSSQLTAHSSQLTAHSSQLTVTLTAHSSQPLACAQTRIAFFLRSSAKVASTSSPTETYRSWTWATVLAGAVAECAFGPHAALACLPANQIHHSDPPPGF